MNSLSYFPLLFEVFMAQNKLVIERVDELEPVPNPHEENMGL